MSTKKDYTDETLILGLQERNNKVLQHILDKCSKPVKHYVICNNGTQDDANDIIQESIIVLFRKVQEPGFILTSSLTTFVYSIAKLMWLKELENRRLKPIFADSYDAIDEHSNVLLTIEKNERLKLYRTKFDELGEDCKKVLRLFYQGTPMSEITRFMGYGSDDYTKKKKYTCKNALLEKIRNSNQFRELGYEKF